MSPLAPDGRPSEWARAAPSGEGRYMRAIPTGALRLTCHGPSVAPGTGATIKARYPGDRATGFTPGTLRGVFAIRWTRDAPLPAPANR